MDLGIDILRALNNRKAAPTTIAAIQEAIGRQSRSQVYGAIVQLELNGLIEPRRKYQHGAIRISSAGKRALRSHIDI